MLTNENILRTKQAVTTEKNNLGSETEVLQSNYLPGGDEDGEDEQEDEFDETDEDTEDDNVSGLDEQDSDEDNTPPLDEDDLEQNDLTPEEADDIDWETEDEDDHEELSE